MRILLLHDDVPPDARPDELDVLVQADTIATALSELGHTSDRLPFSLDLRYVSARLQDLAPDVVFNLVESVGGQGRLCFLAPAVLDGLGMPYTGSRTETIFTTTGKILTKRLLRAAGLPTPEWVEPARDDAPPTGRPQTRGAGGQRGQALRYILKPVWEEASVGLDEENVVAAEDLATLRAQLEARSRSLARPVFAEQFIDGREFNLSMLAGADGPQMLPPAEIHFVDYAPGRPRVVGYRAKWDPASFEFHHTPRCFDFRPEDEPLLVKLRGLARECWGQFDLRGYARVDFRVDLQGQPWILEINANPCIAPDAGFPAAVERAGVRYRDMVARILADALGRG